MDERKTGLRQRFLDMLNRRERRLVADASVTMANGIGDLLDLYASTAGDPTQRAAYLEAADIARVTGQEIAEKMAR